MVRRRLMNKGKDIVFLIKVHVGFGNWKIFNVIERNKLAATDIIR
jgi:hypothetical protein